MPPLENETMDEKTPENRTPDEPNCGLAEPVEEAPRGKPFVKGQSGNPAGRPRGSRNKASLLAEALLEDETEGIIRKLAELARAGDMTALRLCLERLILPLKERPMRLALPPLNTAEDLLAAVNVIVAAVAEGEVSESEAKTMLGLVESVRETLAVVQYGARLSALEARMNKAEES